VGLVGCGGGGGGVGGGVFCVVGGGVERGGSFHHTPPPQRNICVGFTGIKKGLPYFCLLVSGEKGKNPGSPPKKAAPDHS